MDSKEKILENTFSRTQGEFNFKRNPRVLKFKPTKELLEKFPEFFKQRNYQSVTSIKDVALTSYSPKVYSSSPQHFPKHTEVIHHHESPPQHHFVVERLPTLAAKSKLQVKPILYPSDFCSLKIVLKYQREPIANPCNINRTSGALSSRSSIRARLLYQAFGANREAFKSRSKSLKSEILTGKKLQLPEKKTSPVSKPKHETVNRCFTDDYLEKFRKARRYVVSQLNNNSGAINRSSEKYSPNHKKAQSACQEKNTE